MHIVQFERQKDLFSLDIIIINIDFYTRGILLLLRLDVLCGTENRPYLVDLWNIQFLDKK